MRSILSILTLAALSLVPSVQADTLYQCDGTYQNSPCTAKQKSKVLNNLPGVSRYDEKKIIANEASTTANIAADEEVRARPRPEAIENEPATTTPKKAALAVEKKIEQEATFNSKSFENLEQLTAKLKSDLDKKAISAADAETQSIRLRVLHDTLCSRQDKITSNNARSKCDKSEDNIQAITLKVRSALNKG